MAVTCLDVMTSRRPVVHRTARIGLRLIRQQRRCYGLAALSR
ncbi:hypothetical protein [Paractinoplanes brasiliensis]|nr:hypothetical protein [Actinoplanes brasiliensis]